MDRLVRNHFDREAEWISEKAKLALGALSPQLAAKNMIYSGVHVTLAFKIHSEACMSFTQAIVNSYKKVANDTGILPTPEVFAEAKVAVQDVATAKAARIRQMMLQLTQRINSGEAVNREVEKWVIDLRSKAIATANRELEIWAETEARKRPTPKLGPEQSPVEKRKVFVVHGRDSKASRAMFSFLRSIGLDPIEWSEAIKMTKKAAPYVGEVLDIAFANAQAIVVLFSGDDLAKLDDRLLDKDEAAEALTPQARPNVLFEAGLALGRHPDRTILVELGRLRGFSDIGGRHTIRMNNSVAQRQELATRLQTAGCAVQISGKAHWHTEGDFELAPTPPKA